MISIIMTVFNVEKYIKRAITSVLSQSYSNLELILVDDCSTDNSYSIIKSFNDPRIKYIKNIENMGAGYSRNLGIKNSSGDYIITIDGDDWIEVNFLKNLRNLVNDCDMVFGGMFFDYEDDHKSIKFNTTFGTFIGKDKFKLMSTKQIIFLNTCLVKKELYDIVEYDIKRYNEDTPTLAKLLYYSNKIKIIDEFGYHYIQRSNSLCRNSNEFYKHLCLLNTTLDLLEFFDNKPEYSEFVTINDLFLHLSYLGDLNNISLHQDDFNQTMLKIIKRIHRE